MSEETALPRLILGSGRSGTTWVLDCAADANGLRPIFEPLHPEESVQGREYGYGLRMPGDADQGLEVYFRELASGRFRSRWIDYRGRRAKLYPRAEQLASISGIKRWLRSWEKYLGDRRVLREAAQRKDVLIKCIRANLMAGWFARTLKFSTVMVVRHPGAVVESQHRLGGVWDPDPILELYRRNTRLHQVTGRRYLDLLARKLTRIEALTLNWVIENQLPVARSVDDGYPIIHYEELILRPDEAWARLCESLSLSRIPAVSRLRKPSQQASGGLDTSSEPRSLSARWRDRLSSKQRAEIQGVLDATECRIYHVECDTPVTVSGATR